MWQAKAWVDRPTALAWVKDVIAPLVKADIEAGVSDSNTRYLLLADNLDAQIQDSVRALLKSHQVDLHLLPPGKTDFAQPIDAGFGRAVKHEMGEAMDKWLDDDGNLEKWEGNALTASDRRILMTHWLGAAFKKVSEDWEQVRKYWEHTGGLVTIDGDFGASKLKFEGTNDNFVIPDPFSAPLPTPRPRAEPEPEDTAPQRDSVNEVEDDPDIDDINDPDEDEDVEPASFPSDELVKLPAPSLSSLEPGSRDLVGRLVCFNWAESGVGWCVGTVVRENTDRRSKIGGNLVNYVIYYEIDEEEAEHALLLDNYETEWVLVEPRDDTAGTAEAAAPAGDGEGPV